MQISWVSRNQMTEAPQGLQSIGTISASSHFVYFYFIFYFEFTRVEGLVLIP